MKTYGKLVLKEMIPAELSELSSNEPGQYFVKWPLKNVSCRKHL